jgi:signal transduction histidine kinase
MASPRVVQEAEKATGPSGVLEQRARALESEVAPSRQLEAELRARMDELKRAFEAERAERAHKEILFQVTDAASRAATLEEIYEAALDALGAGLGVARASVLLFDTDGVMRFKAWRGLSEDYRAAVEGHTPWKPDEKDPSPVLVSDVRADPSLRSYSPVFEKEGIGALAFFPLFSGGRLLGKFMLYYPGPHAFTDAETRLAQGIAHQVAFAVERKFAHLERDRILGIVSHDLKNPLTAVTVAAATLLRQNIDPVTASSVRRIASGASRMERLIAQLLEFAQARHGGGIGIERRAADLREVISRVVDELETAYPGARIAVRGAQRCSGSWDDDRVAEVFSNLIGNAVQHGGGTEVRITLKAAADVVSVEIHNGGPAIPAGLMPKLFDPYRRGGQSKGGPEGVGRGLVISREIVRAHGGTIAVESDAVAGTTFTVRLPRA